LTCGLLKTIRKVEDGGQMFLDFIYRFFWGVEGPEGGCSRRDRALSGSRLYYMSKARKVVLGGSRKGDLAVSTCPGADGRGATELTVERLFTRGRGLATGIKANETRSQSGGGGASASQLTRQRTAPGGNTGSPGGAIGKTVQRDDTFLQGDGGQLI